FGRFRFQFRVVELAFARARDPLLAAARTDLVFRFPVADAPPPCRHRGVGFARWPGSAELVDPVVAWVDGVDVAGRFAHGDARGPHFFGELSAAGPSAAEREAERMPTLAERERRLGRCG